MFDPHSAGVLPHRVLAFSLLAAAAVVLPPSPAGAHFVLQAPASWSTQDALGSPQKLPPCGSSGAEATGEVTAFQEGQTITITVNETIFHPGHYRISLAVHDRSELPAEPVVTPGSTPCGSVEIQDPPVFPVLADGVFAHTAPFSGPQSIQIKLPEGVTCDHCTLQILEFMGEHGLNNPGGCFYHHCADVSIQSVTVGGQAGGGQAGSGTAGGGQAGSGLAGQGQAGQGNAGSGQAGSGQAGGDAAGAGGASAGEATDSSGCSLQAAPAPGGGALVVFGALVALWRRRRR
jgi:MYXO-CTERM domain-containing protein